MATEYDYGNYSSYSQDPTYRSLNTNFRSLFGSSFGDFDYNAYLSDAAYRKNIDDFAFSTARESDKARQPARFAALQQLREYFERGTQGGTFEQSGGEVDVRGIFEPLKAELGRLTDMQIRLGRGEISQGAERARKTATESLAGTGLGRSGVAAQTFQGIETEASRQTEKLGQEARLREAQGQFQIESQIRQLAYSEELRERGMNEQDIRDAAGFYRQLQGMQYQSMLEQAAQDDSWWDDWAPVFETLAGIGLMFVPGGQVAGAGIAAGGIAQYGQPAGPAGPNPNYQGGPYNPYWTGS